MFVFGFDGGLMAEIYFYSFAHYCFTVEDAADSDGGFFVEEGDDYAPETLEGGPRVDWCGRIDQFFDGLNVVCSEDFWVIQICDEEGI